MSKQFMMIEQDGKIVNKPMIKTIKNPLMSSILMLFVMTMIPSSIYGQFLPQLNYVNLSNIRYPDESVNMVRISPNNSYIVVVTNLGTLLTYTPLGDLVGTSKWSGNIVAIEISKKGMVVLFNSTGFYRVYIWDWSVWRQGMLGQILVNSASYWGDKELIAVNFGNNVQLYELSELGLVQYGGLLFTGLWTRSVTFTRQSICSNSGRTVKQYSIRTVNISSQPNGTNIQSYPFVVDGIDGSIKQELLIGHWYANYVQIDLRGNQTIKNYSVGQMIISQKYCFELGYLVMILLDRVVVLNKFGIEIWKSSVNQSVGIGSFVGFDCGIKKEQLAVYTMNNWLGLSNVNDQHDYLFEWWKVALIVGASVGIIFAVVSCIAKKVRRRRKDRLGDRGQGNTEERIDGGTGYVAIGVPVGRVEGRGQEQRGNGRLPPNPYEEGNNNEPIQYPNLYQDNQCQGYNQYQGANQYPAPILPANPGQYQPPRQAAFNPYTTNQAYQGNFNPYTTNQPNHPNSNMQSRPAVTNPYANSRNIY